MSFISVQPQGGYKNQKNFRLKNWKAECPKCSHIEIKEGDGTTCPNCNGEIQMTYAKLFGNNEWQSEEAGKSWRQLSCVKGCGWSANQITCSKCDATIQGDFFKGEEPAVTTNCFVATSAFKGDSHATVIALQDWRDTYLLKRKGGRQFVAAYYKHGPKLAKALDRLAFLKPVVRGMLKGFVRLISQHRQ